MITDNNLVMEQAHPKMFGGVQRVYRFKDGYGLSVVNAPILHSYPFAWEIAVVTGVKSDGSFESLSYDTELTSDVEVFDSDDDANNFIERASVLFGEIEGKS